MTLTGGGGGGTEETLLLVSLNFFRKIGGPPAMPSLIGLLGEELVNEDELKNQLGLCRRIS